MADMMHAMNQPFEDMESLSFANKSSEELWKKPGEINGQAFQLSNLDSCTVHLMDFSDSVRTAYLTSRLP